MAELQHRPTAFRNERRPLLSREQRRCFQWVVPVRIEANGKQLDTCALVDSGSGSNYIKKETAAALGLPGPRTTSRLVHGGKLATLVRFSLCCRNGSFSTTTTAFSTKLKLKPGQVDSAELKDRWHHLRDVDVEETIGQEVTVVIGIGLSCAHQIWQTVLPPCGTVGPRAIRTNFGWIAVGETAPLPPRAAAGCGSACERFGRWFRRLVCCSSCGPSFEFGSPVGATDEEEEPALLFIAPVRIAAYGRHVDTYALVSSASTVHFAIKSRCGTYSEPVTAFAVPTLKATPVGLVDPEALKDRWHHLRHVDIESTVGQRARVLIGIAVAGAHHVFQTVSPPEGVAGPRAIDTPFGWIAVGSNGGFPLKTDCEGCARRQCTIL